MNDKQATEKKGNKKTLPNATKGTNKAKKNCEVKTEFLISFKTCFQHFTKYFTTLYIHNE